MIADVEAENVFIHGKQWLRLRCCSGPSGHPPSASSTTSTPTKSFLFPIRYCLSSDILRSIPSHNLLSIRQFGDCRMCILPWS